MRLVDVMDYTRLFQREKYFNSITIMIQEHICVYYKKDGSIDWMEPFLKRNNIDPDNVLGIIDGKLITFNIDPSYDSSILCKEFNNYLRFNEDIVILIIKDIIKTEQVVYGMTKEAYNHHKFYMLQFIGKLITILGTGNVDLAIDTLCDFRTAYINRVFPVQFYREFNNSSKFVVVDNTYKYELIDVQEFQKNMIDISYNEKVIRYLFSLVAGLYLK